MIAKKNPKADLEKKRFAFFQIGLILAGALCLAAFEYSNIKFTEVENQTKAIDVLTLNNEIPKDLVYTSKPKPKRIKRIDPDHGVNTVDKIIVDNRVIHVDIVKPDDVYDPNEKKSDFDAREGRFPVDTLDIVEHEPLFPGGEKAMYAWVVNNIEIPEYAYRVNGTIHVSFVVNKLGEVVDVKIAKGIDEIHDRAAIAVVQKMPKWSPGEQFGKPVPVRYHLPIRMINR